MFNIQIRKISINDGGVSRSVIENCNLNILPGKTFILLGSNGSGKTTLALALTGLLNRNVYNIDGSVLYNGLDLLDCDSTRLNEIRKYDIKHVFQDPVNSFNPLKKFAYYLDPFNQSLDEINELLNFFLLPSYDSIKKLFPHEVSVGMAQRIALVMAFLAKPKLIIMDEPNSALDLTSSNLLFQRINVFTSNGSSVLVITQDLAFAQKAGDEIAILHNKTIEPVKDNNDFFK